MGEQQEYELELKVVGFEEILTSDELTIVDAPKGVLELRDDGVFYTAPAEPYAMEAPFEDWPEESKTFHYDAFTFQFEDGPVFAGLIELNTAVMETVSHGGSTHPWDVESTATFIKMQRILQVLYASEG